MVGHAHDLAHLLRQGGALLVAAGRLPVRERVVRQRAQPCMRIVICSQCGLEAIARENHNSAMCG